MKYLCLSKRLTCFIFFGILFFLVSGCFTSPATTAPQSTPQIDNSSPTLTQMVTSTTRTSTPLTVSSSIKPTLSITTVIPPLPFPDNPDPSLCGIPTLWGRDEPAWLNGFYEGELVRPVIFLYDSHLRQKIVTQGEHGSQVKILLSQSNPQLNYFLVKLVNVPPPNEGWVPAPFISFEPIIEN